MNIWFVKTMSCCSAVLVWVLYEGVLFPNDIGKQASDFEISSEMVPWVEMFFGSRVMECRQACHGQVLSGLSSVGVWQEIFKWPLSL